MAVFTNVFRRGASFYFRARVPLRLQAVVGRKELWRSLRTSQASEGLQSGDLTAAKKIADEPPGDLIKYLDPDGSNFCTPEAYKARFNLMGHESGRHLVNIFSETTDPVYRYAVANRQLSKDLTDQDDAFTYLCNSRNAGGEDGNSDYENARRLFAVAIQVEIDSLKSDAVSKVGAKHLADATTNALAASDVADQKNQKQICLSTKSEVDRPTDPLILKQARKMILTNCANAGM